MVIPPHEVEPFLRAYGDLGHQAWIVGEVLGGTPGIELV